MDSGEDTGKKRQIQRDSIEHPSSEDGAVVEKVKKLRKAAASIPPDELEQTKKAAAATTASHNSAVALAATNSTVDVEASGDSDPVSNSEKQSNEKIKEESPSSSKDATTIDTSSSKQTARKSNPAANLQSFIGAEEGQDLESALSTLVGTSEGQKERLSAQSFLTFRMGHAGDASRIASWYRETTAKRSASDQALEEETAKDKTAEDKSEDKSNNKSQSNEEFPLTLVKETSQPLDSTEKERSLLAAAASEQQEAASSLELWLSDGLGNEDIPPSLFALLAYVNHDENDSKSGPTVDDAIRDSDDDNNAKKSKARSDNDETESCQSSRLAAVALLTVAWEHASRLLRVEFFHVNSNLEGKLARLVERRMWLRLSALSLMTACEMYIAKPPSSYMADSVSPVSVTADPGTR